MAVINVVFLLCSVVYGMAVLAVRYTSFRYSPISHDLMSALGMVLAAVSLMAILTTSILVSPVFTPAIGIYTLSCLGGLAGLSRVIARNA